MIPPSIAEPDAGQTTKFRSQAAFAARYQKRSVKAIANFD
jgi:hypothetical protein